MLQFRAVHILIGDLQECIGIVAISGIYADSKAGSDPQLTAAVGKRLRDGGRYQIGDAARLAKFSDARKHDDEFISAYSSDQIRLAHAFENVR